MESNAYAGTGSEGGTGEPFEASAQRTILVVDDESNIRILIAQTLQAQGYTVLEEQSGSDALETCREYTKPIDLLITDYSMPLMTGKELIDRISLLRPQMKILCLSGRDPGTKRIPLNIARLPKPFTLKILLSKVRELLGDTPA
jgi:DNA-binding response OmpR family regulator